MYAVLYVAVLKHRNGPMLLVDEFLSVFRIFIIIDKHYFRKLFLFYIGF